MLFKFKIKYSDWRVKMELMGLNNLREIFINFFKSWVIFHKLVTSQKTLVYVCLDLFFGSFLEVSLA